MLTQLDFLYAKCQPQKLFDRRGSFRDIQNVISKIDPEILKTVIESGSNNRSSFGTNLFRDGNFSVPSTPKEEQSLLPALPVYTPTFRPNPSSETAPLTIFYNGSVVVFDVSQQKAENIIKIAEEIGSKDSKPLVSSREESQILVKLDGDLPIARSKSLRRFLEKRKERLTLVSSPYEK